MNPTEPLLAPHLHTEAEEEHRRPPCLRLAPPRPQRPMVPCHVGEGSECVVDANSLPGQIGGRVVNLTHPRAEGQAVH